MWARSNLMMLTKFVTTFEDFNVRIKSVSLPVLAFALTVMGQNANAGTLMWDFSNTVSNGTDTAVTTATLTTVNTLSGGAYQIIGITGTWTLDGVTSTISRLNDTGYQGNDNELFPTGFHIDNDGLSFRAGTVDVNSYLATGGGNLYATLYGPNGSSGGYILGTTISELTLTPAPVPEPSSVLLMSVACVALYARFRRSTAYRSKAAGWFVPSVRREE